MRLLLCGPSLTDIDIPVEILKLNILAPTVDGPLHVLVDFYLVFSATAAVVLHCLLRRSRLELDIEVAVDLAVVGPHADVGFEIGREGYVDLAIQRAERHRL